MTAQQNFVEMVQANNQAAQRYAVLAMQGAQRLLRVQMDVTRDVINRNGSLMREAWPPVDPTQQSVDWPSIVGQQIRVAMEMTRTSMEGAARVYSEYARIIQEQAPELTDAIVSAGREGAQAAQRGLEESRRQMSEIAAGAGQRGLEIARQTADDTQRFSEQVGRQAAETVSSAAGHSESVPATERKNTRRAS
jgi:hypothetical protein